MFNQMVDENIQIKLLEFRDAYELFELVDSCRGHLRNWLPWVDASKCHEDTLAFIEYAINQYESKNGFQAGIWFNGKIAGIIGFHKLDWVNRSTSIGYWLGEKYTNQGIMTRACKALIDYAFTDLQLNRVEIRCAVYNHKSKAIPQRLGFKLEGTIRDAEWLYDHYVDHIVYGILAKDWFKIV